MKAIFATLDKNNDSFIDNDEIGDFEGWLAMEVGHASVSWFDSEVRQSMENSATHEAVVREETIITAFTHKYLQMKKTFREAEFSRFIEGCQLAATHTANGLIPTSPSLLNGCCFASHSTVTQHTTT